MEINDLVSRLALACGIGLLIGLERGWRTRAAKSGSRTAGIRTFAISGLLGGVIGVGVDAATGAMNEYPNSFAVPMQRDANAPMTTLPETPPASDAGKPAKPGV